MQTENGNKNEQGYDLGRKRKIKKNKHEMNQKMEKGRKKFSGRGGN